MVDGMMQPDSNNIIPEVRQIIQTLATLKRERGRDWFSWREVAKYQEGSQECATLLSAYANLPEAVAYFSQTADGRSVRLTSAGHSLLHRAGPSRGKLTSFETQKERIGRRRAGPSCVPRFLSCRNS
jgi:hypothetical protein